MIIRLLAFSTLLSLYISSVALAVDNTSSSFSPSMLSPEPGTYKTVTVTSTEECSDLCREEAKTCRGLQVVQLDTKAQTMLCHLNDGLSAGSTFTITPPNPLELESALADLNAYRAQFNFAPLKLDERLIQASKIHALDLARHGNVAHEGSDKSNHAERANRVGYDFAFIAENVAGGQKSWEDVFYAWQGSPGHNDNLLHQDVTEFGLAMAYDPTTQYIVYWAMLVALPVDHLME